MLACCVAQTAIPSAFTELGLNPPWNHPHVMFLVLSRSPAFLPDNETVVRPAGTQSSKAGRASPMTELPETLPAAEPFTSVAPCVCAAIRFRAPGVEGP